MNLKQLWYNAAKSGLRKPLNRVRHWGLDRNDAFIASYPRSGNTWLRFVLFDVLVSGQTSGFDEVNHIIPEVGLHLPGYPLLPGAGRLIKTHEPYQKEYRKAIYLVRDVRDVILSEYAYQKALGWIPEDFELFLGRFLDGQVNPFRPWQEHVPGWLDSPVAGTPNLLVIKFEDMRRDTEQAVTRALDFLDVVVEPEVVRAAIANNSVQKMQEKEARQPQLSSSAPKPTGAEETRFIRSGSIGGWRNRLTPAQAQRIEQRSGQLLARLGYPVGDAAQSAGSAAGRPIAQQAVR
jgi:hypothetical protein